MLKPRHNLISLGLAKLRGTRQLGDLVRKSALFGPESCLVRDPSRIRKNVGCSHHVTELAGSVGSFNGITGGWSRTEAVNIGEVRSYGDCGPIHGGRGITTGPGVPTPSPANLILWRVLAENSAELEERPQRCSNLAII